MTASKALLLSVISVSLISCGGTTHYLTAGNFSKDDSYKVNSYYGCCGCEAKYFNIKSGKQKIEQVIYSYGIGSPTKFVFNYDKSGKIISCDKFVATTLNDFTIALSDFEKRLFSIGDTRNTSKANYIAVKFSEIKGFRKPIDNDISHSLPLIKKGYKLPVNY
ncbi:hypothetical protein [Terrimonas pollutisoli]|uniref:hypothetical protein n=1 Tax=Terrimonas pollutisoli TaxID=3034147 RepID=UPI0023EC6363|nr:hypothetical protein [Terrimonas sp. H1YJ31]